LANGLSDKISDICEANVINLKQDQILEIIKKIDQFEENTSKIDKNLEDIKKHNHQLKQAIPFIDEQIKAMQEAIDLTDQADMGADELIEELFRPRDEITEKLLKKDIKLRAIQESLEGLRAVDDIEDVREWTKSVRKLAAKQFSSVFKI